MMCTETFNVPGSGSAAAHFCAGYSQKCRRLTVQPTPSCTPCEVDTDERNSSEFDLERLSFLRRSFIHDISPNLIHAFVVRAIAKLYASCCHLADSRKRTNAAFLQSA
jgi:hypothetical protein